MNSNRYYITLPVTNQEINIPIEITEDFLGRTDSIELYEQEVLDEVIGIATDFEIGRYSHNEYLANHQNSVPETSINYEFFFYNSGGTSVSASTPANVGLWVTSYEAEGFTPRELYYFANSFSNSFFKLDFYDSPDEKNQTNYFTIIIPTQQGFTTGSTVAPPFSPPVNIKIPKFKLDFVGDKEGFFIYWLDLPQFLTLNTFYMSAKFFDAKIGVFVRMMNEPQCNLPNKFQFDSDIYFYNKVILSYEDKTYQIFDGRNNNIRVGTKYNPMKWYEYVNPG